MEENQWECERGPGAENDYPIIWSDSVSSDSSFYTKAINVLLNDTICQPLKHHFLSALPAQGNAKIENSMLYNSYPEDFVGIDSLKYTICQTDSLCDEAKVFIEVK